MLQITLVYLRTFMIFVVAFLVTYLLFSLINRPIDASKFSLFMLKAGLVTTLFLGTVHIMRARNAAAQSITQPNDTVTYRTPTQHLEMIVSGTPFQVLVDLQEKLLENKWKLLTIDDNQGFLRFKTKLSIWSWGEIVQINIRPDREGMSKVVATSKPYAFLRLLALDYGKNRTNLNLIESVLHSRAAP